MAEVRDKRALIITAYIDGKIRNIVDPDDYDLIVCADAGYSLAIAENITPDVMIGDFDSVESVDDIKRAQNDSTLKCITLPTAKDDTDTLAAVKFAISEGYYRIRMLGGIGARLDHTIANLQTLAYGLECGAFITMSDEYNSAFLLKDGWADVYKKKDSYLSIFSWSDVSKHVTIKGTAYDVVDAEFSRKFPVGVSNEIVDERAVIAIEDGILLVVVSSKSQAAVH